MIIHLRRQACCLRDVPRRGWLRRFVVHGWRTGGRHHPRNHAFFCAGVKYGLSFSSVMHYAVCAGAKSRLIKELLLEINNRLGLVMTPIVSQVSCGGTAACLLATPLQKQNKTKKKLHGVKY